MQVLHIQQSNNNSNDILKIHACNKCNKEDQLFRMAMVRDHLE